MGGLPELVSQPGDAPALGSPGADQRSSSAPDRQGSQGRAGSQTQPGGGDSQHRQSSQRDARDGGAKQRKGRDTGECCLPTA